MNDRLVILVQSNGYNCYCFNNTGNKVFPFPMQGVLYCGTQLLLYCIPLNYRVGPNTLLNLLFYAGFLGYNA